jgi:predicted SnoaL-like aldol condensation-catalyzing enzyme
MSAEENKALMERYFEEVFNKRNAAFGQAMISPRYVAHFPDFLNPGELTTAPTFGWDIDFTAAIPDYQVTIDGQIAEGETVASWTTMRGTFTKELRTRWGTFPPSGKPLTFAWVSINRFEDGKIVEAWLQWDIIGLFVQFGILSLPEKRSS